MEDLFTSNAGSWDRTIIPRFNNWNDWGGTFVYPQYTGYQRSIGQEILEAFKLGIIDRDEAREALNKSYSYTFDHLKED